MSGALMNAEFIYIYENEMGFVCFDRYFEYLLSIKDMLPPSTYEFFSDIERYSLDSKKTLHDAWIEMIKIAQIGVGRNEDISIGIDLLGPSHDLGFEIVYSGVVGFNLKLAGARRRPGRQDLMGHELRLNANSCIEHVIKFDDGLSIYIACASVVVNEVRRPGLEN